MPVHYRDIGHGPAVLFIHGWMVSGRVWDPLLPLLAGYRMIVPDLRGSGATSAHTGSVTLKDYLTDLAGLCESLDLSHTHLVGHNMGGQLAALLAAQLPQRFATLTLMNPVPVQGLDFPDELQPVFRNCGGDRDAIGRIIDMSCRRLDDSGRSLLVEDSLKTPPAVISTGFEAFRRGDPQARLESADLPAMVIATDDPFLPPTLLQPSVVNRLPRARLMYLPGVGHYPQFEAPEETAKLLHGLLA